MALFESYQKELYCYSPETMEIDRLKRENRKLEKELDARNDEVAKLKKQKMELPERYVINESATILFWNDRTKTIVRRASDDEFNPRLAFLTAMFQRFCGMSRNKANKYLANLKYEIKEETEAKKPRHMKEECEEILPKKFKTKNIQVGDKVFHKIFGKGKVIKIINEEKFCVEFDVPNANFHDCEGLGEPYRCFYINTIFLTEEAC